MISVICPTYNMKDGIRFLTRSFNMLKMQTYKDFEVVITDDSIGDEIKDFCAQEKELNVRYIKNLSIPGMGGNTNTAILYAKGDLIKILYQDDYLTHSQSLEVINKEFTDDVMWLATGCTNTDNQVHRPHYNQNIFRGINTIGSPSVITVRNKDPMLFDTKLTYVLDCDYYYRMNERYGPPKLVNDINVTIGLHDGQTTNLLSEERKKAEIRFLINKYA